MAAPNIAPEVVRTLLTPIVLSERGASFHDIVTAFPNPPPPEQVQLWLDELIATDLVESLSSAEGLRYYALEAAGPYWHSPSVVSASPGASLEPSPQTPADVVSSVVNGGSIEARSSVEADPAFAALFDRNIAAIVVGLMPQASALTVFQRAARSSFTEVERQRAFVRYGLDRLSQVTMGECVRHGLEPEQYAMWRRSYSPPPSSRPAANAAQPGATSGENAVVEPSAETPKKRKTRRSAGSREGRDVAEWLTEAVAERRSSGSTPSRDVADVFPKASANGFARLLIEGLDWFFPGLDPVAKRVLMGAVSVLIVGALSLASGSIRVLSVVAVVVIVGALALARARKGAKAGASPSSNGSLKGSPASPETYSERRRWAPRTWGLIGAGCIGVIAVVVGWSWYQKSQETPSDDVVKAYLATSLAPLPVQVPKIDVTPLRTGNAGCTLSFQARVVVTESLYRRLDTAEYLRTHFRNEVAAIDAATALLNGPNGARLTTALRDAPPSGNGDATSPSRKSEDPATGRSRLQIVPSVRLRDVVLLTTETAAGREVLTSGQLNGMGHGSDWSFDATGWYNRPRFSGERKPAGPGVFVSDNPTDMARLTALVADEAAYAATVQATATALAAELERDRQKRVEGLVQLLRPGTLFTGTMVDNDYPAPLRIVIEITESSPTTHRVLAMVRNDGGWSDARAFQGDWAADAEAEGCTLTLNTRLGDLVRQAGPLLEDYGPRTLVLRIRADGSAIGTPGNGPFTHVGPPGASAIKAELMRPISDALGATKSNLVYRGTATSKQTAKAVTLVLRFTEQSTDGATLQATLESLENPAWVRPFRGTIIGNTYRAGRHPIRLISADNDRVTQADPKSPLGFYTAANNFTIALRAENNRLLGDDDRFSYSFTPLDAADADKLTADQPSPSLRPAGTLKSDPATASDGRAGTPLPADLGPSSRSETSAPKASEPKTQNSELKTAAPLTTPLPPLPTGPMHAGAYLLVASGWVPLPSTHNFVVRSSARGLAGIVSKVQRVQDTMAGKSSESSAPIYGNLTFDGRDSLPVVPGEHVVIAYMGPLSPLTDEQLARNPELREYPVMELAPLKLDQKGYRFAPLYEIAPGVIAFGATRVPATIEPSDKAVLIFRCTGSLPSGHYALSCGPKCYEFVVQYK